MKEGYTVLCNVPVERDTLWEDDARTSNHSRGLHDYCREITFQRELTDEESKKICEFLHLNDSPGWTGVTCHTTDNINKYRFTTTWDSSD